MNKLLSSITKNDKALQYWAKERTWSLLLLLFIALGSIYCFFHKVFTDPKDTTIYITCVIITWCWFQDNRSHYSRQLWLLRKLGEDPLKSEEET